MKANELMAGNLVMVNRDGLCIKKGTMMTSTLQHSVKTVSGIYLIMALW